jgi:two-component system osmolarity sensor histidine kinase EnvZ
VNVSAAKQNGALTVEVEDDGPGIPEAEHEHVFRPFYRLDHARTDSGSTGLGLAIARDIARIHGGDIALSRSPLGGLKAVLKVPV